MYQWKIFKGFPISLPQEVQWGQHLNPSVLKFLLSGLARSFSKGCAARVVGPVVGIAKYRDNSKANMNERKRGMNLGLGVTDEDIIHSLKRQRTLEQLERLG